MKRALRFLRGIVESVEYVVVEVWRAITSPRSK